MYLLNRALRIQKESWPNRISILGNKRVLSFKKAKYGKEFVTSSDVTLDSRYPKVEKGA